MRIKSCVRIVTMENRLYVSAGLHTDNSDAIDRINTQAMNFFDSSRDVRTVFFVEELAHGRKITEGLRSAAQRKRPYKEALLDILLNIGGNRINSDARDSLIKSGDSGLEIAGVMDNLVGAGITDLVVQYEHQKTPERDKQIVDRHENVGRVNKNVAIGRAGILQGVLDSQKTADITIASFQRERNDNFVDQWLKIFQEANRQNRGVDLFVSIGKDHDEAAEELIIQAAKKKIAIPNVTVGYYDTDDGILIETAHDKIVRDLTFKRREVKDLDRDSLLKAWLSNKLTQHLTQIRQFPALQSIITTNDITDRTGSSEIEDLILTAFEGASIANLLPAIENFLTRKI